MEIDFETPTPAESGETERATLCCPVCTYSHPSPPVVGEIFSCARSGCGVPLERLEDRLLVAALPLQQQALRLLLPFELRGGGPSLHARLQGCAEWREDPSISEPDAERSAYFLSYARRFLFPKSDKTSADRQKQASGEDRDSQEKPTTTHLTYALDQLGPLKEGGLPFRLHYRRSDRSPMGEHALSLQSARLTVFNTGIAFLSLELEILEFKGRAASYFDQQNAAYFLRWLKPSHDEFELPTLEGPWGHVTLPLLLERLLSGVLPQVKGHAQGEGDAPQKIDAAPPPLSGRGLHLFYDDRMMVYSYSSPSRTLIGEKETEAGRAWLEDETLMSAHLRRLSSVPLSFDQAPEAPEGPLWEQRLEGESKEGAALIAFPVNHFHRRHLMRYQLSYYFDIFLLAAFQRFTLLSLSERLSRVDQLLAGGEGARTLRALRLDLLRFKNQACFSQISNRERGLSLWQRWRERFECPQLLREVNEQSEELNDYLESRSRDRLEWLLRVGGAIAAVIPAILGGEQLFSSLPHGELVKGGLIAALLLGAGLFLRHIWRIR